MKGISGNESRGLPLGAVIPCADNTGAKMISLIGVKDLHTVARRIPAAGVGTLFIASVRKGTPEMRAKVVYAVVVRQRRPYRRADGNIIEFEDNAAVLVTPEGEVRGSEIKGPVAREAAERWPRIAAIASTIV
ncbi:50S ribosomal protein L14 [Ferroplasma acidiphilum]|jgi:large subunit ribosomal protein L14|uniref:Large ribosomal subunit protein uL14 n=2 Tax=Ferroplasma TaxID=74968 RepID=S0ASR2_FERAC|nr:MULTISPECIES: 50S ribosomal protein L14 [Ferroplasma]MCL4348752.1 50S ribosomal protein L14 [Candidatus Thermoplasmatota archaeon]AGO61125.1 50S ribosomal protein L14P [Ferroplasma acidarmanus Fer1]ARD84099.1 50S ribosomal protein L14P [Ferroplasma acidiphilum]NOL59658.1 50S ribosomal protein L14 [Ferroplasma acidiphilum]WMT52999.1 MAG: 50S ribosomal protein L14 [Ferroplasma acidiphilum]